MILLPKIHFEPGLEEAVRQGYAHAVFLVEKAQAVPLVAVRVSFGTDDIFECLYNHSTSSRRPCFSQNVVNRVSRNYLRLLGFYKGLEIFSVCVAPFTRVFPVGDRGMQFHQFPDLVFGLGDQVLHCHEPRPSETVRGDIRELVEATGQRPIRLLNPDLDRRNPEFSCVSQEALSRRQRAANERRGFLLAG
jgi:hypothetical protein